LIHQQQHHSRRRDRLESVPGGRTHKGVNAAAAGVIIAVLLAVRHAPMFTRLMAQATQNRPTICDLAQSRNQNNQPASQCEEPSDTIRPHSDTLPQ